MVADMKRGILIGHTGSCIPSPSVMLKKRRGFCEAALSSFDQLRSH